VIRGFQHWAFLFAELVSDVRGKDAVAGACLKDKLQLAHHAFDAERLPRHGNRVGKKVYCFPNHSIDGTLAKNFRETGKIFHYGDITQGVYRCQAWNYIAWGT
jgi:hypothetical protein